MGLFDLFKKKPQLTEEEQRENKIWDLWVKGKALSPYAELMTYQSEVNNGGHDQYFFNTDNIGKLNDQLPILERALPAKMKENLQKAYQAYLRLEKNEDDEEAAEILEQCDDFFYDNETEVIAILDEYAASITCNSERSVVMDARAMINEWLSAFGKNVKPCILRNHVTASGNFLWHIFTWGNVPCLEGDAARKAFDELRYTEAIIFYDGQSNSIEGLSCVGKFSADEIDRNENSDVYVVAKDFSWTYVRTHETGLCGPFFCTKQ